MVNKISKVFGAGVLGLGLSAGAFAADGGANVVLGKAGASATMNAELRGSLIYSDNGLSKTDTYKPTATSNIGLDLLTLQFKGNINPDVEYKVKLNLSNPASMVEYALGTWWPTQMFGLGIGKDKVRQGGWDQKRGSLWKFANSMYKPYMPFSSYAPVVNLHAKVAGLVTVQMTDDVKENAAVPATKAYWNTANKQPAWIAEWLGDFGMIQPLVQIGSYDINHSKFFDVGAKAEMAGVDVYFDYLMDMRNAEGVDKDFKPKGYNDNMSAITLEAGYTLKGTARPFVYFSMFDVKETEDKNVNRLEVKGNAAGSTAFADNGTVIAVGSTLNMFGDNFAPFVVVENQSGKWLKAASATETESKSVMNIKIGAGGEF